MGQAHTKKLQNMRTIIEKQKFPIMAGMQFGTTNNRIQKVGVKTIKFTYLLHPDGDKQLIGEKEIDRKFFGVGKFILMLFTAVLLTSAAFAQDKIQCKGIKADKAQCSRMVAATVGYCFQHNPDTKRCKGMTKKNEQCKVPAKKDSDYCWRHSQ